MIPEPNRTSMPARQEVATADGTLEWFEYTRRGTDELVRARAKLNGREITDTDFAHRLAELDEPGPFDGP